MKTLPSHNTSFILYFLENFKWVFVFWLKRKVSIGNSNSKLLIMNSNVMNSVPLLFIKQIITVYKIGAVTLAN